MALYLRFQSATPDRTQIPLKGQKPGRPISVLSGDFCPTPLHTAPARKKCSSEAVPVISVLSVFSVRTSVFSVRTAQGNAVTEVARR